MSDFARRLQSPDEDVQRVAESLFEEAKVDEEGTASDATARQLLQRAGLRLTEEQYVQWTAKVWKREDPRPTDRVRRGQFVRLLSAVFMRNVEHGAQLRTACKRGETGAVLEMVRRGCSPNGADGTGRTAMHAAAEFGSVETLRALHRLFGDALAVNAEDCDAWTPLIVASAAGHAETVAALLEFGADVAMRCSEGRTAAHNAAGAGHHEVLSMLLDAGGDPNIPDRGGATPLHVAAMHDQPACCRVLLSAGANADAQDVLERTPAMYAKGACAELLHADMGK